MKRGTICGSLHDVMHPRLHTEIFLSRGPLPPSRQESMLDYEETLLGTPNWEPQEYSRNINGNIPTRARKFYYIPTIFLGFPVWGSH